MRDGPVEIAERLQRDAEPQLARPPAADSSGPLRATGRSRVRAVLALERQAEVVARFRVIGPQPDGRLQRRKRAARNP